MVIKFSVEYIQLILDNSYQREATLDNSHFRPVTVAKSTVWLSATSMVAGLFPGNNQVFFHKFCPLL